jgi:nucleoside-diphosphate-sugar epimerase
MNILIIGGTGLLGLEAARQLIDRGHEVVGVALPPLPEGVELPVGYRIIYGNYMTMSDKGLLNMMKGMYAIVFAAGVDERVEGPAPIYDLYFKYNVQSLRRLLHFASESKIAHAVVLGSYFSYTAKKHPKWELENDHPYIRSRIEQEKAALSFAASGAMNVAVLELPYIFGVQPGRRPVWTILLEQILAMKKKTYYPKGGTAMVTVKQVGQAIVGAIEYNKGGHAYPIGYYNKTWVELLTLFHRHAGIDRPIVTVPTWIYRLGVGAIVKKKKKQGIEMGLDMKKFTPVMTNRLFIDKSEGSVSLGVQPDDIDQAIAASVQASMKALQGQTMVAMKVE